MTFNPNQNHVMLYFCLNLCTIPKSFSTLTIDDIWHSASLRHTLKTYTLPWPDVNYSQLIRYINLTFIYFSTSV